MRFLIYGFWFFVVVFGVTFAGLNAHAVDIDYYFNSSHISLPLLLLLTLVSGVILGMAAIFPVMARSSRQNRRLRSKVKQAQQEVVNLRTMPIKDEH